MKTIFKPLCPLGVLLKLPNCLVPSLIQFLALYLDKLRHMSNTREIGLQIRFS
nr:hypothetical protein [uncultured bacterium]